MVAAPAQLPDAPSTEDGRRRTRRLAWWLFGATIVLIPLFYLLLLKLAEGDYVLREQNVSTLFLRMGTRPRWESNAHSSYVGDMYYAATHEGIELWFQKDAHLASLPGGPSATTWESMILKSDGRAKNAHRLKPGRAQWVVSRYAEKFPAGSIAALAESIDRSPEPIPEDVLAAARSLHAQLPDRLTTKYWLIAALFLAGRQEEGESRYREWRPEFEASSNPRAAFLLYLIENDRIAATPGMAARRAAFERVIPPGTPRGLTQRHHSALAMEELLAWIQRVEPDDIPRFVSLMKQEYFDRVAPFASAVKLAKNGALQLMVQGRRSQAHQLLMGGMCLGLYPLTSLDGMGVLPAIWMRRTMLEGAATCYVAADWAADDLARCWKDWESLWSILPSHEAEVYVREIEPEIADAASLRAFASSETLPGVAGSKLVRLMATEAERELLREGMRVRHFVAARGEWPPIGADGALTDLLLNTMDPPLDPFEDPPRRLRANVTTDSLTLWSIGPDRIDSGGASSYDYRTGARGTGDITLTITLAPKYRFPPGPDYVYADLDDFTARFPHRLPVDPFPRGNEPPMRLVSERGGYWVRSSGPLGEDSLPISAPHPGYVSEQVEYDPTNGFTSRGHISRPLNFAPGTVPPDPTPTPQPKPAPRPTPTAVAPVRPGQAPNPFSPAPPSTP